MRAARAFVDGVIDNYKKVAFSEKKTKKQKKHTELRKEWENHTIWGHTYLYNPYN